MTGAPSARCAGGRGRTTPDADGKTPERRKPTNSRASKAIKSPTMQNKQPTKHSNKQSSKLPINKQPATNQQVNQPTNRVSAVYQIMKGWKTYKYIMKPANSPTQGQPNPRKNRLKAAFGPLFSHSKQFFVGWDWFYIGNRLQETQPNRNSPEAP